MKNNEKNNDMRALFENWRRFLNENEVLVAPEDEITQSTGEDVTTRKAYTYCSVILDAASQDALKNIVNSNPELSSLDGATAIQKMCHHMTIKMGTSLSGGLADNYRHGAKVTLNVSKVVAHVAEDGNGISAALIDGQTVDSGNPHITMSLKGRKPHEAKLLGNKLPSTFEKNESMTLSGYVNIPDSIVIK